MPNEKIDPTAQKSAETSIMPASNFFEIEDLIPVIISYLITSSINNKNELIHAQKQLITLALLNSHFKKNLSPLFDLIKCLNSLHRVLQQLPPELTRSYKPNSMSSMFSFFDKSSSLSLNEIPYHDPSQLTILRKKYDSFFEAYLKKNNLLLKNLTSYTNQLLLFLTTNIVWWEEAPTDADDNHHQPLDLCKLVLLNIFTCIHTATVAYYVYIQTFTVNRRFVIKESCGEFVSYDHAVYWQPQGPLKKECFDAHALPIEDIDAHLAAWLALMFSILLIPVCIARTLEKYFDVNYGSSVRYIARSSNGGTFINALSAHHRILTSKKMSNLLEGEEEEEEELRDYYPF